MAIQNIIRINREDFDRLSEATKTPGYEDATFQIAVRDMFPLHEIHYIFENINQGETYEIDMVVSCKEDSHAVKCTVFFKNRMVGMVQVTMDQYDEEAKDWHTSYRVLPVKRDKKSWLEEVGLMTVTTNMMVSYAILHPKRVFAKKKSDTTVKQRSKVSPIKNPSDDLLYSKLSAYIQKYGAEEDEGTGHKGSAPTHEFDVRGHMRYLASGKVVYVRPHTKCKGRGEKVLHEYRV